MTIDEIFARFEANWHRKLAARAPLDEIHRREGSPIDMESVEKVLDPWLADVRIADSLARLRALA